ncbi:hypothetical protein [Pollutimonas bauzanensis]|uniref:hypothetical protein n=1 Tax=Pollutimonas bauzanensis TaxID=658167 RepID=UPI000933773F|nr:hypothetical protein [Pollutimonas bauzanensis]
MLDDIAGIIAAFHRLQWFWPSAWPIVGDATFWDGMLRIWLIMLPVAEIGTIALHLTPRNLEKKV